MADWDHYSTAMVQDWNRHWPMEEAHVAPRKNGVISALTAFAEAHDISFGPSFALVKESDGPRARRVQVDSIVRLIADYEAPLLLTDLPTFITRHDGSGADPNVSGCYLRRGIIPSKRDVNEVKLPSLDGLRGVVSYPRDCLVHGRWLVYTEWNPYSLNSGRQRLAIADVYGIADRVTYHEAPTEATPQRNKGARHLLRAGKRVAWISQHDESVRFVDIDQATGRPTIHDVWVPLPGYHFIDSPTEHDYVFFKTTDGRGVWRVGVRDGKVCVYGKWRLSYRDRPHLPPPNVGYVLEHDGRIWCYEHDLSSDLFREASGEHLFSVGDIPAGGRRESNVMLRCVNPFAPGPITSEKTKIDVEFIVIAGVPLVIVYGRTVPKAPSIFVIDGERFLFVDRLAADTVFAN